MKLLRYGRAGQERPAILDNEGRMRDISRIVKDITPATISPGLLAALRKADQRRLPLVKGRPRLGPPVGGIGKLVCIGLNYSDHAAETGAPIPKEPIVFLKANSSICGPNDTVIIPRDSKKSDWEVELAIVIGRKAQYVEQAKALNYVFGYTICNDVSEREFQLERGGSWDKGKSCDTFGPLGPWLVTREEVKDPQNLKLWLELNGKRVQNGTTAKMIFGVAEIVAYVSRFMTLHPGDVISTGTPPGVGLGMKPPLFLKPGDVMRLGIEGMGEQVQKVAAARV
ncbi:MAG: fumarylacetoacetate hydrolase family protein [Alphaproteobacteria bacterium]|nr:fumarylacetoacetate hydrolase family protein [Alphaproteobacteria bacterium]